MDGITIYKHKLNTLDVAFRFKGLQYLVADMYGNFYNLEHCPNRRVIPFKMLVVNRDRVYYHGTPYTLAMLRKLNIKVKEVVCI